MEFVNIPVKSGTVLRGRYKRAGREGNDVTIEVVTPVELPSGRLGVVGTVVEGKLMGRSPYTLLLAEAFGPKSVEVVAENGPIEIPANLVMPTKFSLSWAPCESAAPDDLEEWTADGTVVLVKDRAIEEVYVQKLA